MKRARALAFVVAFLFFFVARSASAHKPSDSYLSLELRDTRVIGRWDIALRDLDNAMSLDADGDGNITWGEVHAREGDISAFAFTHLTLGVGDAPCPIAPGAFRIASHSDGSYASIAFVGSCASQTSSL